MMVQNIARLVSVFIRCLRANASSLSEKVGIPADLDCGPASGLAAGPCEPCHAEPTTHHLPLSFASSSSL